MRSGSNKTDPIHLLPNPSLIISLPWPCESLQPSSSCVFVASTNRTRHHCSPSGFGMLTAELCFGLAMAHASHSHVACRYGSDQKPTMR